jgi:hypothetical protein
MSDEINLANQQMVSVNRDQIVILMPRVRMSKQEALVHAAWLVALAADDIRDFHNIVIAVANL